MEIFSITDDEQRVMALHREKILNAELSRLSGEPVFTPEEVDKCMEKLFLSAEQ